MGEILTEYENESEYTDRKLKTKQKQYGYLWRGNIRMPRWHIPSCDGGMRKKNLDDKNKNYFNEVNDIVVDDE